MDAVTEHAIVSTIVMAIIMVCSFLINLIVFGPIGGSIVAIIFIVMYASLMKTLWWNKS